MISPSSDLPQDHTRLLANNTNKCSCWKTLCFTTVRDPRVLEFSHILDSTIMCRHWRLLQYMLVLMLYIVCVHLHVYTQQLWCLLNLMFLYKCILISVMVYSTHLYFCFNALGGMCLFDLTKTLSGSKLVYFLIYLWTDLQM